MIATGTNGRSGITDTAGMATLTGTGIGMATGTGTAIATVAGTAIITGPGTGAPAAASSSARYGSVRNRP